MFRPRQSGQAKLIGFVDSKQGLAQSCAIGSMPATDGEAPNNEPDNARIVGIIKDCDEAEAIDLKVLAKRDALNRVLMCLWVVHDT